MTEVMQRRLGDQVVGICDSPVGLARRILTTLQRAGLAPADLGSLFDGDGRIHIGYSGLNHLGWLTSLNVDGVDVLPRLLERPDLIESFEEGRLFGADLVQALGAVPNEYLHYYYYSRDDLAADRKAEAPRGAFLRPSRTGSTPRPNTLTMSLAYGKPPVWSERRPTWPPIARSRVNSSAMKPT